MKSAEGKECADPCVNTDKLYWFRRLAPSDMVEITKAAFATMAALVLALPHVRGEAKHQLDHGVPDAFKAFRVFQYVTAISDTDLDGDLDCVSAVRTDFSEEPLQATYVLLLKGLGVHQPRNLTYHVKPGPTPDVTLFTVDDDYDNVQESHFHYTDYKNCAILDFPFEGRPECLMWTTKDTLGDVPEECIRQYKDACGDAVKPYDEESCAAFIL